MASSNDRDMKVGFCKQMISHIMDSDKEYDFEEIVPLAVRLGHDKEMVLDYLRDVEFLEILDEVFLGRIVLMKTQALLELKKIAKGGNMQANVEIIRAANKKIEQARYKRLSEEFVQAKHDKIRLGMMQKILIEQGKADEVHEAMTKANDEGGGVMERLTELLKGKPDD